MWIALLKRSDWRLLRAATAVLSLIVLLLVWGFNFQRLATHKTQALEAAQTQQNNLAIIVADNFKQLLDSARFIALASEEWWDGSPHEVANRLSAMSAANPAFLRVALYDTEARRIYSSTPIPDDEFLLAEVKQALLTLPAMGLKSMTMPDVPTSPEEAWHKPLLFPVGKPDSALKGLLMVTLDLGYLLKVYQHIKFGASGVIHILNEDTQEILEWRPEGLVLNNKKRHFRVFADQSAAVGTLKTDLFQDGQTYLSSFNYVEGFPFLLVVSRSIEGILKPYQKSTLHSFATLGILTLIIATALYFIARSIAQHGKLFSALIAADEKNRSLITRLEDEKKRAFRLAARDHLTGLPNRRTFNKLAQEDLENARQQHGYYALMYLDLDRFKLVNDTLGHHVGDILLQTVAKRLQAALRDTDIVARLGGDEFAILLRGLESIDQLSLIADRIIKQVSQPVTTQDGQEIHVSPSIGIAIFPRDGEDFDTLCQSADAAMYESKRKGRSTYTYYKTGLKPSSERRFKLEQRLPKAIAEGELVLHYQPKVRLSDFQIIGFEALVRWQHPEFGLVYPDDFISLAEETGLIVALGEWVARSCCLQQARWQAEGLDCVPIAINISPVQLQHEELPSYIQSLLTEFELDAALLEIEITETVLLKSMDTAVQVLRELKDLGVQIALDDFGSGFSSLSYVRTLPIHTIKIDKQFIRDIRNSTQDAVLVASIISLAHNLGMRVIVEGVETLEQLIYLKTAGCNKAQGYYFSRPVPADQARDLLRGGVIAPASGNP